MLLHINNTQNADKVAKNKNVFLAMFNNAVFTDYDKAVAMKFTFPVDDSNESVWRKSCTI